MNDNLKRIQEAVQKELSCSSHRMDHVMRVYDLCVLLAQHEENVDLDVLLPAALLHDIARVIESQDRTGEIDHAILGGTMADGILRSIGYGEDEIGKIKHCVVSHRYRSGNEPQSLEAKILFDADKLDAIGAIGIARTFMLAGQFGQSLVHKSLGEYEGENTTEIGRLKDVSEHSPFIEHEVKFKNIPERLCTAKAKEIGRKRLEYMSDFFRQLELEMAPMRTRMAYRDNLTGVSTGGV